MKNLGKNKSSKILVPAITLICILTSGCATTTFKAHPFLDERIKPVRTIAVMPMDIEVYKITAGGVKELIDEYIQETKNNIKVALDNELTVENSYRLLYLPDIEKISDYQKKAFFRSGLALYAALDTSIIAHTYPPNMEYIIPGSGIFKDKLKNFDYTFGSNLSEINSYIDNDVLLFVRGGDYLSSGGRIAFQIWATIITLGGYTPTRAGPPHLSIALVDAKTGDILWYNFYCPQRGYNFRNQESVKDFVKVLLRGFPNK